MRELHTYSLIKALYDEGKDYIDAFWPILLQVMPPSGQRLAVPPIADAIRARFGLSIPVHTVQTLADRARKQFGYLDRSNHAYSLTAKGRDYLAALESPRQVQRRLEELVDHACAELSVADPSFAHRGFTLAAITSVIEKNYHVFDFIIEHEGAARPSRSSPTDQVVLDYFVQLEGAHPTKFATLRDLILGSTLAGLLKRDDITDATRHFGPTDLYLDTNILLSLLGLPFEVECRPALELFGLIGRSNRFHLKVFDFTLDELTGLLRGYREASKKYLPGVKVKAIYSSLQFRGITPGDVTMLIATLEEQLRARGVSVVETSFKSDGLPVYGAGASLSSYKPDQDARGQAHDLAAISEVAVRRGKYERKVERARIFFLTEDYRLSNYCFVEGGHRDRGTVSEVMPDRLLTNLLWLKQPDSLESLPVSTVIAMHSRDLFIDRRVWDAFHRELGRIVDSGELPEDGASILLYDGQVHRDLAALGAEGREDVNKEWLLSRLSDAKARQDAGTAAALERKTGQIASEHERKRIDLETERQALERTVAAERRATASRQQRLLAFEKEASQRFGGRVVLFIKVLGMILVLALTYRLYEVVLSKWPMIESQFTIITWGIPVGLWMFGWILDPRDMWARLGDVIADKKLARRLSALEAALGGGVVSPPGAASAFGNEVREVD